MKRIVGEKRKEKKTPQRRGGGGWFVDRNTVVIGGGGGGGGCLYINCVHAAKKVKREREREGKKKKSLKRELKWDAALVVCSSSWIFFYKIFHVWICLYNVANNGFFSHGAELLSSVCIYI